MNLGPEIQTLNVASLVTLQSLLLIAPVTPSLSDNTSSLHCGLDYQTWAVLKISFGEGGVHNTKANNLDQ